MNKIETTLIKELRLNAADYLPKFLKKYGRFIEQDVLYHIRLGLITQDAQENAKKNVANDFLELIGKAEGIPDWFNIKQWLHLLIVLRAYNLHHLPNLVWPDLDIARFTNMGKSLYLTTGPSKWLSKEKLWDATALVPIRQHLLVESDHSMTPEFLSTVLMPYVGAVSSIQQVCNSILRRPHREVVIKSISQMSPMDINLIDAAEAINALKEDIIPWRRKNAQKLAKLKEEEVAVEIKKREAEALEIRRRSSKDKEELKKIAAETALKLQEVESMKIENERKRFELKKDKLKLAIEIASKMNPDIREGELLAYAVQLLPAIDTIAESEIEPKLLV